MLHLLLLITALLRLVSGSVPLNDGAGLLLSLTFLINDWGVRVLKGTDLEL